MKVNEDCFFFKNSENEELYGCTYFPYEKIPEIGFVFVPPVGHERLRCYRECVNLARNIAYNGFAVLRFDYRGEGESFGLIENTDVSTRLKDIQTAIIELRKRSGINKYCLFGFRAGAVFALQIAEKLNIKRIVLCEPILDNKGYIKNLIRANIIMQRDYFGKICKTDAELREDLDMGTPISIYGFHLSSKFIRQFEKIDINSVAKRYTGNALIIHFSVKEIGPKPNHLKIKNEIDTNGSCEILCSVNHFSWITKKVWNPFFSELSQCVVDWINA